MAETGDSGHQTYSYPTTTFQPTSYSHSGATVYPTTFATGAPTDPDVSPTGDFKHGFFNCFENTEICILAYLYPMYVLGRNAEAMGSNCFLYGMSWFIPIVSCLIMANLRGRIREKRKIKGNYCADLMKVSFCPYCSLVQEGAEVKSPVMACCMDRA